MRKIYVVAGIVVLIMASIALYSTFVKSKTISAVASGENSQAQDSQSSIIWNAYSIGKNLFIYPSTWTLSEDKNPKGQVTGFSIASQETDSASKITVSPCTANATDCTNGFSFSSNDQSTDTINILNSMQNFFENPNTSTPQ